MSDRRNKKRDDEMKRREKAEEAKRRRQAQREEERRQQEAPRGRGRPRKIPVGCALETAAPADGHDSGLGCALATAAFHPSALATAASQGSAQATAAPHVRVRSLAMRSAPSSPARRPVWPQERVVPPPGVHSTAPQGGISPPQPFVAAPAMPAPTPVPLGPVGLPPVLLPVADAQAFRTALELGDGRVLFPHTIRETAHADLTNIYALRRSLTAGFNVPGVEHCLQANELDTYLMALTHLRRLPTAVVRTAFGTAEHFFALQNMQGRADEATHRAATFVYGDPGNADVILIPRLDLYAPPATSPLVHIIRGPVSYTTMTRSRLS